MPSQRFRRALAGLALAGSIALFPSPAAAAGLLGFGKGERALRPADARGLLAVIVDFLRELTDDEPPPADQNLSENGASVDPNGGARAAAVEN